METIFGTVLYSKNGVYVLEKDGVRVMKFGLRNIFIQGAMYSPDKNRILLEHMQEFERVLLNNISNIDRFLLLGLGTGTAAHVINSRFQKSRGDIIELSEEVIEASNLFYDIDIESIKITNADAFAWIKSADCKYDFIFCDISTQSGIPIDLLGESFHLNINKLIKPSGSVMFNIFGTDKQYKQFHAIFSSAYALVEELSLNFSTNTYSNFLFLGRKLSIA